jgi:glycolate oxidase iron-sulfur subunit
LIKAVDEGRLDLTSPGFMHQMSECLDCRACEAVCPSGVAYGRLLEPARTQIERATAPRRTFSERVTRNFLLKTMFSNLAWLRAMAGLLRFYQHSGLQQFARRTGLLRALRLEEIEALAPPVSERFFVPHDQRARSRGERKATAFMHAGCVMQVAFAEVDEATLRVLQRSGCEVVVPAAQGCCGAIAVHAGEMDLGRELGKRNILAFERSGADVYVVNAAGCGSTIKEYEHLFASDPEWAERAARFSAKVRDVTELLDLLGLAPELGVLDKTVSYQDACHLAHAQLIISAPRRLLAAIPGLTLREMNESSLCCGSAGIYNVTQPAMASRLGTRKVENALATGAEIIATANPGCALQIAAGLRKVGSTVRVAHVVELIDESYAAYNPTSRVSPARAASTLG